MSHRLILVPLCFFLTVPLGCRAKEVQDGESKEAAALFDAHRVIEVSVELAEEDWDTLRRQERSFVDVLGNLCTARQEEIFTFVPATVTIDGTTLSDVGVRKKGFLGSLDTQRPSLKFSFDQYETTQRLHGLERFTVNNNKQDPSNVRQCLAYQTFADAGLPAPRCNFAHVTVNGRDLGIYTHIEEIKKPFIRRHFSDDEGNLYEGVISDFTETGKLSFQQKTNNEVPANRADIDAVQAALADPSPGLAERLDRLIDMDSFVRLWVMETVTSHWDGYASNHNNYYLYNDPDSGRFHFIPWGTDGAFATTNFVTSESSLVYSTGLIARLGYDDPEIRERYFSFFEEVLTQWDSEGMLTELDRMEALLQPFADGSLARDIDEVRNFLQTYPAQLLQRYQQQGAPHLQDGYDGCE